MPTGWSWTGGVVMQPSPGAGQTDWTSQFVSRYRPFASRLIHWTCSPTAIGVAWATDAGVRCVAAAVSAGVEGAVVPTLKGSWEENSVPTATATTSAVASSGERSHDRRP
jgi:hypothetical protein